MCDREELEFGLNGLLWEEWPVRRSGKQSSFWYNRTAGEFSKDRPPIMCGGFVCEGTCAAVMTVRNAVLALYCSAG